MRKDKRRSFGRVGQVIFSVLVAVAIIATFIFVTHGRDIPVLQPHGLIADQERNLILLTVGLGMVVVIPVFIMLFTVAWRYRASNTKAVYQPDFASHRGIEALWWGIPCLIILILAVITVIYTHILDPYKAIDSNVKPVNIQVVALDWKWLFIYPDQNIATLNYANIPVNTPINLTITSDAPMNSFWVPALSGQVYAMSGMSTQLHIMASSTGSFYGSSANISGQGFADMHFNIDSISKTDFDAWTKKAAMSDKVLNSTSYEKLAEPSRGDSTETYSLRDSELYNEVIMKYMSPGGQASDMDMSGMSGMSGMGK